VYEDDIAKIFAAHCAKCHAEDDAGAGFRVEGYLQMLGCVSPAAAVPDAGPADDAGVRLLDVLARKDHRRLLTAAELARVREWVRSGAPLHRSAVHQPGMLNPRSSHWHGRLAARARFAPLRDPKQPDACGRCHDGAPVRPSAILHPAAGAPACTTCHREPAGVLACGTCHGDGAAQAYGGRNACDQPSAAPDAHAAHLDSARLQSAVLQCKNCHPAADATLRGTHANGMIDLTLDVARAGKDARFYPDTGECAVRCHNQGGARARPRFDEAGPMGCGDCHESPPPDHYAGLCNRCHAEANADGTRLSGTRLHLNAKVDVGDGREGCAFCHGEGGDPMPPTPSHLLHRSTLLTQPIACTECHVMPQTVTSAGHLDMGEVTPADVVFGERARARGQIPVYEGGTCRNVACHGSGLPNATDRQPRWDAPAAQRCTICHDLPPGGDHPQDASCASIACHGSEVRIGASPELTARGRKQHINGTIDVGQ
jgi:predicted CxxxxCH...CXXCH cytochrome family protein